MMMDGTGAEQGEEEERWDEPQEGEEERWDEPQLLQGDSAISHMAQQPTNKSSILTSPSTSCEPVNMMALNTNKAGMEGLDKERVNKIIMEASKGSRFYENEKKKESQVNQRVDQMRQKMAKLTEQERRSALIEVDKTVQELEDSRDLSRSIVHLDMDAFYAAVEEKDDPSLKDKPMAVGGTYMLSTSNYHARKYGVRAGMPGFIGKKLCPELIMVPTHFDKYREVSEQVREVLAEYDPNFSPMSLDEAYMDLTEHMVMRQDFTDAQRTFGRGGLPLTKPEDDMTTESGGIKIDIELEKISTVTSESEPTTANAVSTDEEGEGSSDVKGDSADSVTFGLSIEDAVNEIRFRIQQRTQLTASAGIAPNCMLAKICSDKNKPNGQYRIEPDREIVMNFINVLPIRKVSGIGKVTEKLLSALGIHTCADLYKQRALLHLLFSDISSHHFLRISLGLGSTHVERDSERKSMSTERTFGEINKSEDLLSKCKELCEALAEDLAKAELKGKTVGIKLKTVKFELKTRAFTVPSPVSTADELFNVAQNLMKTEIRACQPEPLRLRLMGVRLSSLESRGKSNNRQGTITKFFKKKEPTQQLVTTNCTNSSIPQADSNSVGSPINNRLTQTECREPSLLSLDNRIGTVGAGISDNFVPDVASTSSNNSNSYQDAAALSKSDNINTFGASTSTGIIESSSSTTPCLVCPICNKEQPAGDLEAFNTHVDVCLNKSAIKEMLHEQAETDSQAKRKQPSPTKGGVKRSGSTQQNVAKRRKQDKKQSSTLHKFFN